jgi:hypothetical protein
MNRGVSKRVCLTLENDDATRKFRYQSKDSSHPRMMFTLTAGAIRRRGKTSGSNRT